MKYSAIVLFLTGFFSVNAQELTGRIVDASTNQGVVGAHVYLIQQEIGGYTDSLGNFSLSVEASQTYLSISVSKAGFERYEGEVTLTTPVLIALEVRHVQLEEVAISSPGSEIQQENIMQIETHKLSELNLVSGRMGEALSKISGVYQASLGSGISKPVIRGQQGTRVVTFLNGLRIENQQWGGDHGLALGTLGIGTVEVIKGPASLAYGADALGGVIYFGDENYTPQNTQSVKVSSRFESASLGSFSTVDYKVSVNKLRFSAAASFGDFADYKLPNGKFVLNSRFSEIAGKAAIGYSRKKWVMNARYFFSQNSVGLPGHSHDSIPDVNDFQVATQGRDFLIPEQVMNNHFFLLSNRWFLKKGEVSLNVGHTFNQLREYEEKVTVPAVNALLNNTYYNAKFSKRLSLGFNVVAGLQGSVQFNRKGISWEEALIPDFNQQDHGAYGIVFWKIGGWRFQGGARYDYRFMDVFNSDKWGSFRKDVQSVNGSVGSVYQLGAHKFRLNASTGFRGPHVSELSADGVHHGAYRYEIGSIGLKSERGNQFDFVYEYGKDHIELIVNPFFNLMQNYIIATPTDSIIEGFRVYEYRQLEQAYLYGVDAGVHLHPHFAHWLHLESSYSYLVSEEGNGTSLSQMPQNRISSTLKIMGEHPRKKKVEFNYFVVEHQYFFRQERVAQFETTSPYYQLVNLAANFKIAWKNPLSVGIGVRNVFNEDYIDHLSRLKNIGLAQPGRNFYLQVSYAFGDKLKRSNAPVPPIIMEIEE